MTIVVLVRDCRWILSLQQMGFRTCCLHIPLIDCAASCNHLVVSSHIEGLLVIAILVYCTPVHIDDISISHEKRHEAFPTGRGKGIFACVVTAVCIGTELYGSCCQRFTS